MFGIDNNTVLLLHAEDFNDSSNNNIKVTNNGVTIDGNGKFGKCFNINNTQIDFPPLSALKNFHLGNYTIDFWINQTGYNGNYPTVFYLGSGAVVNRTFMLYSSSTKVRIEVGNGQNPIDFLEMPPIPLNEWIHLAIVRVKNTLIVFKNGIEQGRKELTGIPYTTSNPCFLGNYDGSFVGKIDEFRISNIARWTENFKVKEKEYFNDASSNTSLVESVEITNMCYENLVNLKNNLKNALKYCDIETQTTENFESMINKMYDISIGKRWASGNHITQSSVHSSSTTTSKSYSFSIENISFKISKIFLTISKINGGNNNNNVTNFTITNDVTSSIVSSSEGIILGSIDVEIIDGNTVKIDVVYSGISSNTNIQFYAFE